MKKQQKLVCTRDVLSKQLKAKGMTISQLSRASGVPNSTLAQWSSGVTPKNPSQALAVANVLGISLHFFLFGEEEQASDLEALETELVLEGLYKLSLQRVIIKKKE
ncbi:MAG: helix-turn-helix domain-containing protein [Pseudobdellovibrionaceae bacterium]